MSYSIKRAAVLGSGLFGSALAAHLANAGIPTLLLDACPDSLTEGERQLGFSLNDKQVKNRYAFDSKQSLLTEKPSPITSEKNLDMIEIGNFTDDMKKLSEVDWIIEGVEENIHIKQQLLTEIDKHRKHGTIVSTNTFGLSLEQIVEHCSSDLQSHFLSTHFFHPPRYLRLLELTPSKYTSLDVFTYMKTFTENILGKRVVIAKDTPNFIANRVGMYGLLSTVHEAIRAQLTVGEVDSLTGQLIGRPPSATFRTIDIVGLDLFQLIIDNVANDERKSNRTHLRLPSIMDKMIENNWIGVKTNKGFYTKTQENNEILQLNLDTLEYEKRDQLMTDAVKLAIKQTNTADRIKTLISEKGDQAGDFVWNITKATLLYAAKLVGNISDNIVSIDQTIKWGFGWELGPFEMWDELGLASSVSRMEAEGESVPIWIKQMIELGYSSFYTYKKGELKFYNNGTYELYKQNEKKISLQQIKDKNGVIDKNEEASLLDIGDNVLAIELHGNKLLGKQTIEFIKKSIHTVQKGEYIGLVIKNGKKNNEIGIDIEYLLKEAKEQNFSEIDFFIREIQNLLLDIKYSEKPIVVALSNDTSAIETEIMLSAPAVQVFQEVSLGLSHINSGLIPFGGGTKESYLKILRDIPNRVNFDLLQVNNDVFNRLVMADKSFSAQHAKELGYLNHYDGISMNEDHLLSDAKNRVIALAKMGYKARSREKIRVSGEAGYASMLLEIESLRLSKLKGEQHLKIAENLAYILSGGRIQENSLIDEQVMLDLEREAFINLIREKETHNI